MEGDILPLLALPAPTEPLPEPPTRVVFVSSSVAVSACASCLSFLYSNPCIMLMGCF